MGGLATAGCLANSCSIGKQQIIDERVYSNHFVYNMI